MGGLSLSSSAEGMARVTASCTGLAGKPPAPEETIILYAEMGSILVRGDYPSGLADGERLHGHGPGIFYDGEIGFEGARAGDHIDHFLVDIDVGHGDHALRVGVGMGGIVNQDGRPWVFSHGRAL